MDMEFRMITFDEDNFDLTNHQKKASDHAKAVAHNLRVRRKVSIAKVVLVILLFAAGFCLYYLANDLIGRHNYNKYHTVSINQTNQSPRLRQLNQ